MPLLFPESINLPSGPLKEGPSALRAAYHAGQQDVLLVVIMALLMVVLAGCWVAISLTHGAWFSLTRPHFLVESAQLSGLIYAETMLEEGRAPQVSELLTTLREVSTALQDREMNRQLPEIETTGHAVQRRLNAEVDARVRLQERLETGADQVEAALAVLRADVNLLFALVPAPAPAPPPPPGLVSFNEETPGEHARLKSNLGAVDQCVTDMLPSLNSELPPRTWRHGRRCRRRKGFGYVQQAGGPLLLKKGLQGSGYAWNLGFTIPPYGTASP
eukprot:s999_g1.t1